MAICGLDCASYDIYKITQANDPEYTARVVEKVRTEYGDLTATAGNTYLRRLPDWSAVDRLLFAVRNPGVRAGAGAGKLRPVRRL